MDNKKNVILNRAWRLFLRQGYSETSMRSIAQEAEVSLGLVTYHFGTKDNMALIMLERRIDQFKGVLEGYVDLEDDPVLYSASLVRLNFEIMSLPQFKVFYLDAMKNDLYFKTIENRKSLPDRGMGSLVRINERLGLGHSAEYLELFGNYLCVSMERTLVLYPETHKAVGSIPDLVFRTYMGHLDPSFRDFDRYCRMSEGIVGRIMGENPGLLEVKDLFDDAEDEEG
nr:TetR/AcrR family transcriptional regulator [uncultured Dethiosulfovibrio sp.]